MNYKTDIPTLKILLAEDSEDDIYLISKALNVYNIELKIITNGIEAFEYLNTDGNNVDVVLLDYKLPGMDGFEIMQKLDTKMENFALLFLTADTLVETAVEAMKLGAMDFFPKFKDYKTLYDQIIKIHARYSQLLESKILKEALVSSEKEYRMMFENIQDIYFEITSNGQLLDITPSVKNILGYGRYELKGSLFSFLFKQRSDYDNIISRLASGEDLINYEIDLINNDDADIKCSLNISRKQIDNSQNYKYVGTIRDISTYKKLEEMFFQAQKMDAIGKLSGSVAHDYNNYLQIILVSAQLSLLDGQLSEKTKERLKNIIDTTQSASKLTRSLLTLSRKHKFEPVVTDLNENINKMKNMIKAVLDERIQLELVFTNDKALVLCDPIHFEQVVINMVVNARDAMPNGGMLKLEISREKHKIYGDLKNLKNNQQLICLSIVDSGTGMDKSTIEKIFDPFFTTKSESKGTGLGLSTVFNILEQNNGVIEVESEIDKGSAFKIYFPEHVGYIENNFKDDYTEHVNITNKTILLVENNDDLRLTIGEMLLKAGYEVLYSPSCKVAQYTVDNYKGKIDIGLIDVILEDGNGFDLKEYITGRVDGIKIVLMSGYGSDNLSKYKDNPCYTEDILDKPFDIKKLLSRIN
ncbi:MAG: response regulator [Candidatus Delongbacteria bacterium]|nr:response regulator [Candidatus Delongbacteria bacterium]